MNSICFKDTAPGWDSLPAFVVKNYASNKRLSQPFVQLKNCYVAKLGLCFSLAAYENSSHYDLQPENENNCMKLFICLDTQNPSYYEELTINTKGVTDQTLAEVSMIFGSDLQGSFWGAHITIPNQVIQQKLGRTLEPDDIFAFNLFKFWKTANENNHFGRLFGSIDLVDNQPFVADSFCRIIKF